MNVTEDPVQVDGLTEISELKGGHKGVLFRLQTPSEQMVVKFQNERPLEALAGTLIMRRAGGNTPRVREGTMYDLYNISRAVRELSTTYAVVCGRYYDTIDKFKYVLLMDFAKGRTLKKVREDEPMAFLAVICDRDFQRRLGRILAGDLFAGNPDRMFAKMYEGNIEGWYHEQNLFVAGSRGTRPVAIDNAFRPGVMSDILPWGAHVPRSGFQHGSIALAFDQYAKDEAGVLFDKFLSTTRDNHPHLKDHIKNLQKDRTNRKTFVKNVASAAKTAMQKLLRRGQGWNKSLRDMGATQELLNEFTVRKRLLRQAIAGTAPGVSYTVAQDAAIYRKWVLTHEFTMVEGKAEELLEKGVFAYKQYKEQQIQQQM